VTRNQISDLLYAFQQALLYENACIVFFLQKTGDAVLCIHRKDRILLGLVWILHSLSTRQRCVSGTLPCSYRYIFVDEVMLIPASILIMESNHALDMMGVGLSTPKVASLARARQSCNVGRSTIRKLLLHFGVSRHVKDLSQWM
jgi:hypothetical protein